MHLRKPLLSFILCAGLFLSGCASFGDNRVALIQRVLDDLLPATFVGDFDGSEKIPTYVDFTLAAGNLRRTETGWTFDWLEYHRNGPLMSSAHIVLGKRPR